MKKILKMCALAIPNIRQLFQDRNELRLQNESLREHVSELKSAAETDRGLLAQAIAANIDKDNRIFELLKQWNEEKHSEKDAFAESQISAYFSKINELEAYDIEGMLCYIHKNEHITEILDIYKLEPAEPYNDYFFLDLLSSEYGVVNVIDVGVNYAQTLILLSKYLSDKNALGLVAGYEPNSRVFDVARHTIKANGFNAHLEKCAISNINGTSILKGCMGNAEDMRIWGHDSPDQYEVVETRTLDDEISRLGLIGAPLYLKIDTQGSEWEVFNGAEKLMASEKVIIKTEFVPAIYREISALEFLRFYMKKFVVIDAHSKTIIEPEKCEEFCETVINNYHMAYTDLYLIPIGSKLSAAL